MIKFSFLIIFLLMGVYSLRADEALMDDQGFMKQLDNVKNPFDDGLPKPVEIPKPVLAPAKPIVIPRPKPVVKPVVQVVTLPELNLEGVIVGDGIYQAIINDKVVTLSGVIAGARVIAISKQGVELLYKGKKFFKKVD